MRKISIRIEQANFSQTFSVFFDLTILGNLIFFDHGPNAINFTE